MSVWAPAAHTVTLHTDSADLPTSPMLPLPESSGWWRPSAQDVHHLDVGTRYAFAVDDGQPRPDPRSTRLPDGVHGWSMLHRVPPEAWTDDSWFGLRAAGAVLYELHIGTFTAAGTFDAAIERLDHLVELGVDMVELMPVNAFNGSHNWGYDGVGWYAVQESYGGPDGLARFVDACHVRGLGVALDVVYNHLGPSGNYLPDFGPYLSEAGTSWGASLNLDGPQSDPVRDFILGNALRWFSEFHIDALRLDAVHALVDHRAVHLLEDLAAATDALAARLGRPLSLIAESDLNDPRLISARGSDTRVSAGYGLAGQWADDIHHAIHVNVSGETQGYYGDFAGFEALAKVLRWGFFHDGTYSSFRGRNHGRPIPTDQVAASALIAYTCNHDQIGNRAIGDRPSAYLSDGQLAIKAALVLLSPFTPMLFMGEEWAASTPFQFFTSHPEPDLGRATAEGRRAEFAEHGWFTDDVPDPQDRATFAASKLDWSELDSPTHARMLDFYRSLIALRKSETDFTATEFDSIAVDYDEAEGWFAMHRRRHTVLCRFTGGTAQPPFPLTPVLSWQPSTDTVPTEATVIVGVRPESA